MRTPCAISQQSANVSLGFTLLLAVSLITPPRLLGVSPVEGERGQLTREAERRARKEMGAPNPIDRERILQRMQQQQARRALQTEDGPIIGAGPELLGLSGTDRVLVVLVEFAGTNTFTWTPGVSTWDPLGRCDSSEFDGGNLQNAAASQFFAAKYGIAVATNFTYSGPLHNEIPRPNGTNDPSETTIWVPDFTAGYYSNIIFGNGVVLNYDREDGSVVNEDYTGRSVRDYYEDISGGVYTIMGAVLGWVRVTNSVWCYGGDGLPGARSCSLRPPFAGAVPGGGNSQTLVRDALNAAKAAYPNFDWATYDQNYDGLIDRLWIIHAGLGEEDHPALLNRTSYGEGAMWSHSSSLGSPHAVTSNVSALSYIMMPENAGLAVLVHEFAHNLGAIDLYSYGDGQTSVGFWSVMCDSWVGFPLGFLPEGMDPMHLDQWGWLSPLVISDPAQVYSVKLGQASRFPADTNLFRAAKIELPNPVVPLLVQPLGQFQWWGGKQDMSETRMTLAQALRLPGTATALEFQTAYETETGYDYFYVDASTNAGASWQTLAQYSGTSAGFPNYQGKSLSLASLANRDVLLRFRYVTDPYVLGEGPFVDDIVVRAGTQVLLSDNAETDNGLWNYTGPWGRNSGVSHGTTPHSYYLQWRNTSSSGGYDQALGDPRFRFGPANTGMIVWYENDSYTDNSILNYLTQPPSFGPKGILLVVDSHSEPYLDPYWVAQGVSNAFGTVFSRGGMRDAPFSRWDTVDFHLEPPWAYQEADFPGRRAEPQFSDSRGYYPGIQEIASTLWRTWQWDASVVLPSTANYGVLGPGYTVGTPLQTIIATRTFIGTNDVISYRTNLLASGLTQNGADGNPGSTGGEYGWNARIVYQTDSWAEVVIWNNHFGSLDGDTDGIPNWQEVIAGTDPADSQSFLRITDASYTAADQSLSLEWPSATNRVYCLLQADSINGVFQPIAGNLFATPPLNSFQVSSAGTNATAYFRLLVY